MPIEIDITAPSLSVAVNNLAQSYLTMNKQWSTINRYFVLILMLAAFIWFLVIARDLIGPLAIAALLAYLLDPAVSLANKRVKLPRNLVVIFVYLAALTGLIALGIITFPILSEQAVTLAQDYESISQQIEVQMAREYAILGFVLPTELLFAEIQALSTGVIRPDAVVNFLQSASTNLAWVLIILVSTYYLLLDWHLLRDWLLKIPPLAYQDDSQILYGQIKRVWSSYVRGQLLLMVIIGVLTWLGLTAVGLPGAAAIGFLAGLLDVIMSVGPAVAMVVGAGIALIAGSTYIDLPNIWIMMIVLGVFGIIQGVENIWLRPRILGTRLKLHPAIIFIGVVGALTMGGILVALIIVPVVASIMIVGRYLYYRITERDPWADSSENLEDMYVVQEPTLEEKRDSLFLNRVKSKQAD